MSDSEGPGNNRRSSLSLLSEGDLNGWEAEERTDPRQDVGSN